jgi:hypothetical protein
MLLPIVGNAAGCGGTGELVIACSPLRSPPPRRGSKATFLGQPGPEFPLSRE